MITDSAADEGGFVGRVLAWARNQPDVEAVPTAPARPAAPAAP
ncbi:hypothetical protein [Streptomyces sp. NPDC017940]